MPGGPGVVVSKVIGTPPSVYECPHGQDDLLYNCSWSAKQRPLPVPLTRFGHGRPPPTDVFWGFRRFKARVPIAALDDALFPLYLGAILITGYVQ